MKHALALAATVALGLILTGCNDQPAGTSSNRETTTGTATANGKSSYVIGKSSPNLGEPWRAQMNADLKRAADAHPNLTVEFKDAQNDTLKQRAHVEEFARAGVDLLIISPKEAVPLTQPVSAVYDAGIPVIVLDRAVTGR